MSFLDRLFPSRIKEKDLAAAIRSGKHIVTQVIDVEHRDNLFFYLMTSSPEGWALTPDGAFLRSPIRENRDGWLHAITEMSEAAGIEYDGVFGPIDGRVQLTKPTK